MSDEQRAEGAAAVGQPDGPLVISPSRTASTLRAMNQELVSSTMVLRRQW